MNHSPVRAVTRAVISLLIVVLCGAAVRLLLAAAAQLPVPQWGGLALAIGCLAAAAILGVALHRLERQPSQDLPHGQSGPAREEGGRSPRIS